MLHPARAFVAVAVVSLLPTLTAHAAFRGHIEFSAEEAAYHQSHIVGVAEEAASCLRQDLARQQSFFAQHGVAAFYGDRSSFGNLSDAGKRAELKRLGKDPALLAQMRPTSCIGLALECLGRGFAKAGQGDVWSRIRAYVILNDADGMSLQAALQKLGWKVLYWNADPTQNARWDRQEKAVDPENHGYFQGDHAETYATAIRDGRYFYTHVDDNRTLRDLSEYTRAGAALPDRFLKVPFFVGIAHLGYHVFPGYQGAQIVEAHSTRRITDPKTLESNRLDPLHGGSPDGAPTGEEYRSGLVAIPPGY